MSEPVLNQDEIDALIHGVDNGEVKIQAEVPAGEVQPYDFASQTHGLRGHLPVLDIINERFVRLFRLSMYTLLRSSPQIKIAPLQINKYMDYVQTLPDPSNLNLVQINPLHGNALLVIDPDLVFAVLDNYFGGNGRLTKIDGRDFTPTEYRVIHMIIKHVFADMQEAWAEYFNVNFSYLKSEIKPAFVGLANPSEIVVTTRFQIELESGSGELHLTLPYSMLEPIKAILEQQSAGEQPEPNEKWFDSLRKEIADAEVEINAKLGKARLTVSQLMNLKPGDVFLTDFTGKATLLIEDVPVFKGTYGVSRGCQAIKLEKRINNQAVADPSAVNF